MITATSHRSSAQNDHWPMFSSINTVATKLRRELVGSWREIFTGALLRARDIRARCARSCECVTHVSIVKTMKNTKCAE